jgi:hypothetical protein
MPDKYEMTDEKLPFASGGRFSWLYRIRALIDIPSHGVKVGDVGGWVESEDNLSHEGEAWIRDSARVYGSALIAENALVTGEAHVSGRAVVFGNAQIAGSARR